MQSKSSMKGHSGSRPLRERTKERRVRLKPNNLRSSLKNDSKMEHLSQDSESAYHTHEASDSIVDKTSSMENGLNGCGNKRKSLDMKLDISPRFPVNGNGQGLLKVDMYNKSNESQESDFPKDSNSEDEKAVVISNGCDKSKRHSQSISSENEDDEIDDPKVSLMKSSDNGGTVSEIVHVVKDNGVCIEDIGANKLEQKIQFEGKSIAITSDVDKVESKETLKDSAHGPKNLCHANGTIVHNEGKNVERNCQNVKSIGASDSMGASSENSSRIVPENHSCLSDQKIKNQNDAVHSNLMHKQSCSPASDTVNSVHFTTDLVQLREITPKSSREGTPTHTQSDVLLQTKRGIVGTNKSDTESESDTDLASTKHLPNVRRRKINVPDSSDTCILRNRRQPKINLMEAKTNSTTCISSSEGETEGQSSEHSRGSRRVNIFRIVK